MTHPAIPGNLIADMASGGMQQPSESLRPDGEREDRERTVR